jgi:DNA-binding NarL/FixJ family response regulator
LAAIGLGRILEGEARVHIGEEPPQGESPSVTIFGTSGVEGLLEGVKRLRKQSPDTLILVFGLYLDLAVARTALRAGARGYIHTGMQPKQIVRALKVAKEGQIVAPRELLEYLISNEYIRALDILTNRQREILDLVGEGLTNAQIAKRLFLTESTIKQHLRAAYKVLGVSNRTEAARLIRDNE